MDCDCGFLACASRSLEAAVQQQAGVIERLQLRLAELEGQAGQKVPTRKENAPPPAQRVPSWLRVACKQAHATAHHCFCALTLSSALACKMQEAMALSEQQAPQHKQQRGLARLLPADRRITMARQRNTALPEVKAYDRILSPLAGGGEAPHAPQADEGTQ